MPAPESRYWQPKQLDAEGFQPEISSFRLYLAAEGKAAKTVRTYTEAVAWFAAAHLRRETGRTCWEEAGKQDVQEWMVWLLERRGRQCGINVFPHRFRHHFSHAWLDCGGAEGDLMELNGWTSPRMLRRYGASARSARARRSYDRIMADAP